jgi:hypothetical protein
VIITKDLLQLFNQYLATRIEIIRGSIVGFNQMIDSIKRKAQIDIEMIKKYRAGIEGKLQACQNFRPI